MERRMLQTNIEGLEPPPRKRVVLLSAITPPQLTGPIRRRPLSHAAGTSDAEEGLTSWSRDQPPSLGWWEVKQHSARGDGGVRWWYVPNLNVWMRGVPVHTSADARAVPHDEFVKAFEWRGLRQPPAEGYEYELMPRSV